MADTDRCDLIEAWAREALAEAVDDLPEDTVVRVEARGDDTYLLTVEVPQGEGAQQLATAIQSTITELVQGDPTLGDRFHEATVSPAGVELLSSGDAGARSTWELTLAIPEGAEDESEEADDDSGDEESEDGDESADDSDDDDSDEDGDKDRSSND